nr:DUF4317 family protein [uncultured Butyrivibrio sp.]
MNRSNVLEIKKTFKVEDGTIDKIITCFVNGNKNKLITNTESFSSLSEEEAFKYVDILKSTLSGTIGKKLVNITFSSDSASREAEDKLYSSFKNMTSNDNVRDEFIDSIIENYDFDENYLLVVGHGQYAAAVKASDGAVLEDETTDYEFMVVAICPVHSTKAGLTLDVKTGRMISSTQVQIVEKPINGFLYPAFNERESDRHGLLWFSKKPEEQHDELIELLTGDKAPVSSAEQQTVFEKILSEVTDDDADFEVIKNLHDNLLTMTEEAKYNSEDKKLEKEDIKEILKEAGVDQEKLEDFDHVYERASGDKDITFVPQNLMTVDKFNVKAPDVEIKIKSDKTSLVQKRRIDGKNCIVVALEGGIRLNGILVSDTK